MRCGTPVIHIFLIFLVFFYDINYFIKNINNKGYVAPEIVNLKGKTGTYSAICDVFSIGIIFHLM